MEKIPIAKIKKVANIRNDNVEIEDLASSIKEHGLLQPIIVSKVNGGYHLVAGHRRYNACKSLGWTEIPAMIENFDNPKVIQLTENMQRKNLSKIEEAESVHDLHEMLKVPRTRLAQILGKDAGWIEKRLRLYEVRKHLFSTGMLPTRLIDSMSFDIAYIVAKFEKKYWLQMCAYLLGKRWMPERIEEYCQGVVDPNYRPIRKTYEKNEVDTTTSRESIKKRPINQILEELGESEVDQFSIIKDDHDTIIKLLPSTEGSYRYLLKVLIKLGGEVI